MVLLCIQSDSPIVINAINSNLVVLKDIINILEDTRFLRVDIKEHR